MTMHWTKWLGVALLGAVAGCVAEAGDSSAPNEERLGESRDDLSRRGLTRRQEAIALKAIDDICGDTWCEGEHNFSFERLECTGGCSGHPGSCRLTFRVFSYDTDLETGPTYTRSCQTPGFTGLNSLVESFGEYHSLQPAYYEALTECIGRVESDLPP
jgi:hypothetical protein